MVPARTIALAGPIDWAGFVHAARALVDRRTAPADVRWSDGSAGGSTDLFDDGPAIDALALPDTPALQLPAMFIDRARSALLHADRTRFDLLYRLVWRLHADRTVAQDALDPDWIKLESLGHMVRREMHKMHAFVRFRKVVAQPASAAAGGNDAEDAAHETAVRHVAWFEPDHHVLEAVAPFFARRFAQLDWAILTPRVSVEWRHRKLHFGPGANTADAPAADADEALWLAYYGSIFNPARVKVAAMKKELPVRYWKNLPEARLIAPLMADAPRRVERMVALEAARSEDDRPRRRASVVDAQTQRHADSTQADDALLASSQPPPLSAPSESLAALASRATQCRACPIGAGATQMVWGRGAADARLMLVGEQPGDREDLAGQAFVGPAGNLLKRALADLGWPTERLYMTNAVKHFKYELRGKRRIHKTASQREAAVCSGWLEAEIKAVQPDALIALGATAARSLLGRAVPIGANEGEWLAERADGRPVLIVQHPAALLRMVDGNTEEAYRRWVGLLARASRHVAAGPAVSA